MSRNTLRDKREIASTFRHGKRWRGSFFTLIARRNEQNGGKYVVSIAKKALSLAAQRNLVRRRAQSALRQIFSAKEPHYDCIVQFSDKKVRNFQEISGDLTGLLSNIKQK